MKSLPWFVFIPFCLSLACLLVWQRVRVCLQLVVELDTMGPGSVLEGHSALDR
ncbi:hypothetical protein COLO4_12277 [Corchorus olitorius]|uniref:Uncharacterized protein n=1 Tax=Corchorus olitorius TaxID=93759 RepID=A0A1R3K1C3_9ROSI|nr:hypothetical protein COLO4_12277 [Corchorus olitorius]